MARLPFNFSQQLLHFKGHMHCNTERNTCFKSDPFAWHPNGYCFLLNYLPSPSSLHACSYGAGCALGDGAGLQNGVWILPIDQEHQRY